jgi:hypothetical protein
MSYALVQDGQITETKGRLPNSARRLDTGEWVMGLASAPEALQQATGWYEIIDTAQPADTPTHTHDRSVTLQAGVPTVTWTQRAKTAEELASETAQANRATLDAAFLTFIDGADNAIAQMQAVVVVCDTIQADPAPSFSNLSQALTQVTALQNRVKALSAEVEQIAVTSEAHIRKTVALARYVSNQLDSLDNT